MRSTLLSFAIMVLASPFAPGQSMRDPSSGSDMAKSTSADATFMKRLAEGDLAEVDAGRLADQKSTNADVKDFGQEMVNDHSKNNDELNALAAARGVSVPATIDVQHAAEKSSLQKATANGFDDQYLKGQIRDHEKTVTLLQQEIRDGQDAAVRDFARKTLPVVNHHLAMAKQLQAKLPRTVAQGSQ